jgi:hypothetical protein
MSRRAFAVAAAIIVALVAAALVALSLDATLQWAVRDVQARSHGKLAIEGARGSLLARVHADRVTWKGESNAIAAHDVDVSWSPLWLLAGTAAFDHVHASAVSVTTTASKHEPARLPQELRAPLRLRFADARVDTLSIVNADGDARTFRDVDVTLAAAPDRWSGKLVGVQTTWGTMSGEVQVETASPFALQASLKLVPERRAPEMPPVAIDAKARGNLSAFVLDVAAKAQSSAADAKLRIEPYAPLPVTAVDAALHAVDVRALFPAAPQIVLDGAVKASKAADGLLRGTIDVTNQATGTLEQSRIPIARLTAKLAASPQRWWLEEAVFDGRAAGKLAGTGWVSAEETGFVLHTDGVDLHAVHPSLRKTALAGDVFSSGPFDRQRMHVALAQGKIAFDADALYEPSKLTVNRLRLRAGSGRFDANGSLALDAEHAFALATDFRSFDPSQLGAIRKANLSGHLGATGQLAPVLHVRADGRLSNSTLWGLPVSAEGRWASNKAEKPTIGFDVKATVGHTRFTARGTVKDPKDLKALDVALDLRGQDLEELYTITGVPFPSTPEYRIAGNLAFASEVWTLRGFDGKVGQSDLTGEFSVDVSNKRPFVKADLTSQRLDMTDLGGFIGHDYHAPDPAPDKLLPHYPFHLDKLNAANVDVRLTGKSFQNPRLPLSKLVAHMKIDDGRLAIDPLRFGAAGGDIDARVAMDARKAPIRTAIDIAVRGLQLAKLAPGVQAVMRSAGTIDGRAVLAMNGDSFARMLGTADGSVMLTMNGGSVSDLALRLADLDVANAIGALAKGDENVPLRCVVADFKADDGVLKPRIFVLDSEHTLVRGEGEVDLGSEALALKLVAEPKDASLFALRGPIDVGGTLKQPAVRPELGQVIARTGAAIVLGAIAPPAAIVPFLQLGTSQKVDCGALTQQAQGFLNAEAPSLERLAQTQETGASRATQ